MPSALQIDPESFAFHVNAAVLSSGKYPQNCFLLLDYCNLGKFHSAAKLVEELSDHEAQQNAVDFLSQFVHEYRHHIDLLLSPYGWYRLRSNLELMLNLQYLMVSNKFRKLPIPLSIAANPIDTRFLGLTIDDVGELATLAVPIDSRRDLINTDNAPIDLPDGTCISIGGESVLESLAYYTQRAWIGMKFRKHFEDHVFDRLIRPEKGSAIDCKYNWPARVFHTLSSSSRHRIDQPFIEPFAVGLLLICLNGSVLSRRKRPQQLQDIAAHLSSREVGNLFPGARLARVLGALDHMSTHITNGQELYDTLLTISEEIFGKSYIEELELDVRLNEEFVDEACSNSSAMVHPGIRSTIQHYKSLTRHRRELFERLLNNPLEFIVPHLFSPQMEQTWTPDMIYFFPEV